MDAQLENCIKSNFYAELTSSEREALSIYCTNEDEFNLLKEIYNSTDLQDDVNAMPNGSVKMKLDRLFEENYAVTLDGRSTVQAKRFYQKPLYYLAAASYGSDKGIFGYGYSGGAVSMTNLVSNTGVVATDTTGVGTGRYYLAAASYG